MPTASPYSLQPVEVAPGPRAAIDDDAYGAAAERGVEQLPRVTPQAREPEVPVLGARRRLEHLLHRRGLSPISSVLRKKSREFR